MKKILSFLAVASMALSANAERSHYQDRNYADWGKLKLVGNQLSDKDGNPVQLKGWSTYSLNFVGGCIGGGQWKLMKEYGANIVRLAMPIDDPKEGGSYLAKPDYFKHLIKLSIEETKKLDMYCIVDWHITPDSLLSGDPNDYVNESKDFFGEISKYCADNGYDHVLYEICNEPTCGWVNVKSYAKDVIPVITANQPDAIVIVGTDQWSQKIMEPAFNPIDSTYKKNVMYSFHYDACSHYSLLGDFRNAQKKIPVFVSEWSAVKFNGEGPFCASNSDELLYSCDNIDVAPQVVSWCLWNWGKKDEASSFFTDNCSVNNLSKYTDESGRIYSNYVIEVMTGGPSPCCQSPNGPWSTLNTIPSTESSLWHWDYYNKGGEGYAYHDLNSTAYEKDDEGVVIGYSNKGEEVDVFSLAKKMQWMNKQCPWSTVEDGKVVAWDKSINTTWQDENENPTYKSLNAGRTYVGASESIRPDEGVDLLVASLSGTAHAGELYSNLGWVEEGEWINYTVNVNKPGYYKIKGIIGAEYREYTKNGEISIIQDGKNILRDTSALDDETTITSFGFPRTTKCDDPKADIDFTPWDCWTVSDAKSGRNKEVLCYFKETGEQEITIVFNGNAGGVGPLIFDFYKELNPEDPYVCCGGGIQTAVNTIPSTESSLWHWDYYNKG
ncbi:MAG: cellulase family glycosylhydrolase, partial [Bacteroidales bacterium]|nr:cellulase family glycosylhydrolase [Bacteroidales bacterium]